ncbi:hypothetical protein ACA689_002717 [Vibrio vulnificus]|uniref:Tripartite tricarboxylate transporter TctB family protein n=1 Tax=Vibrio vulnificus TaxID=672 RepID=A0AAW4HD48_VIBVL|nr:hypothetical protein [Vibrio vulnificus]EJU9867320.1 hypothetical protein [Vibrio vulnificus]ELA3117213.1 hypothetical protein [Vibrio vulnificus]ELL0561063.1 hypothetical protein [Vibrio vulnificus]ELV8768054.1 hypothetical protein [Vibrio vulnificus]MBN8122894.1 hypothetical protein [Vibrio vulnificus]
MTIEINEVILEQEDKAGLATESLPSHYYFYLLSFIGSVVLILLQPSQAKEVQNAHGWFSQPYIAPLLGLSIIALFSGIYLLVNTIKYYHCLRSINPIELTFSAISRYRTAVIISGFFFLYIFSLSVIGFALSSFILVLTMLWISNLFTRFWVITSFVSIAIIVLVFRVAIALWFPDVWLFSFLPDQMADFANMYL